ncbi:pilus assembly protein PilM [Microbacterium sp. ET2]|uniref:type IV pilus biogenesis protein PilM n=1 Tax=Microbacterium albipurpureum TaxID=3050384 RepID=UPI00259CC46F|nr:pilus assembly protein PilM [Microbacterium sp. ET2 (Ac-2212)]WJL94333.1 pilus assembly protein PilM [Microbacterium sp. ET2 (Ac-2212)]
MAKTQVAVEITETSVRAVEMTTGRTPTLVAGGEVPLPPGAAKDSEILDRDAVAVALQRLWADAKLSRRDVVLGVGNRRILVREHSTQLTNPAQIRQALPFEVQDRLPVPVDQAVLDFVPTAQDDRGVHGLLVAAVAEHMEELVGALEQAKLRATSIDLTAFGLARALATLSAPGETGLLLGIGEHTTHIVIATGGIPRFVRVVPIDVVPPAEDEDEDADAAERAPQELAMVGAAAPVATSAGAAAPVSRLALRRDRSPASAVDPAASAPPSAPPTLHPAVQAALIDLVGRLRGTVTFYRDRPEAVPIDRTWVTGPYADHPRLLEAVGRVTGTTVTPVTATDLVAPSRALALSPTSAQRLAGTVALLLGPSR